MFKSKILGAGIALSVGILIALPGTALAQKAQKKISYEEAFKRCKAFMDKETGAMARTTTTTTERTARGAACMQKFGYRL